MGTFEKFLICPNCQRPIIRKKALKNGTRLDAKYCGQCGTEIDSLQERAMKELQCETDNKAVEYQSFLTCPNCKKPIIRKSALKKGYKLKGYECSRCSAKLVNIQEKAFGEVQSK